MVTSSDIATEVPTFEPVPPREGSVDAGLALALKDRFDDVPARPQPVRFGPPTDQHGLHHPAAGLAAALVLGLLAAFFGWVSAAPFWLATGAGTKGTAVVVQCRDQALGDHCTGKFTGADETVRLADLDPSDRRPGTALTARVLGDGDVAYAGSVTALHLRWLLGFAAVLACGAGVGAATGVRRLRHEGPRKVATLWAISLAGPATLALIPVLAALF